MWTTIKKIVLFLFGIVLIVFGNKAAINTVFGGEDKADDNNKTSNRPEIKEPMITEEVVKIEVPIVVEEIKVQEKKKEEVKTEKQIKQPEIPVTPKEEVAAPIKIEPETSEPASASE